MRVVDSLEQALSNLWKKKLRTFLTTFGVVIGIGALVSMISFGQGVQYNVTDRFQKLDLFNYITVFPAGMQSPFSGERAGSSAESPRSVLDDDSLKEITALEGVESAFPEVRFPARIQFREKTRFSLVQVMPAAVAATELVKLRAGASFADDYSLSLIISDSLLTEMGITDPDSVIGEEITLLTLMLDLSRLNLSDMSSLFQNGKLPFSEQSHRFTIAGVAERMGFGGPTPLRSDVYIPSGTAADIPTISLTSIWDFFRSSGSADEYSMVNVKVDSPRAVDRVKAFAEEKGFQSFALIDQLEEIRTGFVFMDMFLAAVGMIALVVASLGIVNTMVMAILERTREIGIMKAVGAGDGDIRKIFLFEAGLIGLAGGVFGLCLGWIVTTAINWIINGILARQGIPFVDYFYFPRWLNMGSIVFSILVSLIAGLYPMQRAARVDPVVALRHD
ncbi:MAG: ABC transporter permease [Acidobacteria bacterium]|nr:ABC transporter permease [Acidobacteriota bacterium]